ncbi:Nucleoside-diphosphate-sugar epimerase [Rubellimicrobium thermophilum DSM 16684]|uniref:Nucleoside-diphosphate-sugar epimerase n=1 Tax=Rubellimicrobium thermophilum DSM 16684 TaxID=1123069 RepID=S9R1X2_9RHOB|nr:NAD(P)-dependent oxidoreductase [Rubellimicrobium thermophilum]EPX87641.1 Nucleoside-diphosphate-sugar epimerase [Rubellimicrobium thermophilum DSM 16684]
MERLLITGAAGNLGRVMRRRLASRARVLRLSDIADLGPAAPHEELMPCDLADEAAVHRLVAGCDAILHLGGISVEDRFERILQANIRGVYNLYEAARAHGQPRIIFASSNHTVGFYPQDQRLDATVPFRPDGLYGVSKCFGEALARLYFEKFGQETALVRIGSCFEEPRDHRMLSTWLSHDDFESLIDCILRVPRLGCPVIWGVSANAAAWWDNGAVAYLGWTPRDNAERFRDRIEQNMPRPAPDSPLAIFQGGRFTQDPIHRDG